MRRAGGRRAGNPRDRALGPVIERGLVERRAGHWRATPKGLRFLNDILVTLLPAP